MSSPAGRSRLRIAIVAGAMLVAASPFLARAEPVVQPLPQQSPGMKLNDALNQLAKNPQDLEALIAAGRASLDLGDVQAAIGFFQRADTLWPGSVRVKTGLAGAYALGDDPITAIGLFNEAEKLGPIDAARTADRGLAYDLVGDPQTAQGYYRQSLALAQNDETTRRLALSQAISGDRRGMEITLGPLLQRQDKAAWRTRAFALAILGVGDEAESIVTQTMPEEMAKSMANYLRYMPKLTAAQQAAASNLGQFPRAAEIGHDDPRFAAYVRPRAVVAAAAPLPTPVKTDGKKGKDKDKGKKGKDQQVATAQPAVPTPPVGREVDGKPVQLAVASPVPMPTPKAAPVPAPVPVPAPAPAPAPAPVPAAKPAIVAKPAPVPVPAPAPGFATIEQSPNKPADSFDLRQQSKPAPAPAPAPVPRPAPRPVPKPAPESIDEAFADFTPPSREIEPQAGAVDLRQLDRGAKPAAPSSVKPSDRKSEKPAAGDAGKPGEKGKPGDKAKPGEKTKPGEKASEKDKGKKDTKLTQPSRFWVQVATGRDKSALASDWRRMVKDDPSVFKGKKPFVTAWGQTNRLLTGPFETQKEANAFVAALKKVDFDGAFAWTSAAGQVVDALGGGK
ncbi:MAG: SPOR domain-containing protein [Novosphingobium sp.]